MSKVYKLDIDYSFSHLSVLDTGDDFFMWKNPHLKEKFYEVEMKESDDGTLNYETDFSKCLDVILFSEKAYAVLKPFLDGCAEVKITQPSNDKKYVALMPSDCVVSTDVVDFEWSEYEVVKGKEYEVVKGNYRRNFHSLFYFFNKLYLNEKSLDTGKDLFVLNNVNTFDVFVTDKFREVVEENGLKGFSFDRVAYDSEVDKSGRFRFIQMHLDDEKMGPIIRELFNFYGTAQEFENFPFSKNIMDEYPFEMEYQKSLVGGRLDQSLERHKIDTNPQIRDYRIKLLVYAIWLDSFNVPDRWKYFPLLPLHLNLYEDLNTEG